MNNDSCHAPRSAKCIIWRIYKILGDHPHNGCSQIIVDSEDDITFVELSKNYDEIYIQYP